MDIVTRLEAARDQTLRYFDLSNELLERNYGSGKWSVRFILHHLADAETVLFDRIRRVLSEPKQVLWAFDRMRGQRDSTTRSCRSICLGVYTMQFGRGSYISGSSAL